MVIGIDASRISDTQSTGTERYAREVTSALLSLAPQHQYRLYARSDRLTIPQAMAQQHPHVTVTTVQPRRLWTHIGLAREIALRPPDALFVPAHVLPWSQAVWRTTRSIVTIHDVGYRHFPSAHPLRQRLYLHISTALTARYASGLAVDSMSTLHDLDRFYGVPEHKMRVAYPGLMMPMEVSRDDMRTVREKWQLGESIYALYVGTLQPRKNLRRLLTAWGEVIGVWRGEAAPVLVIAGARGWGGEDLQAEAQALGIARHVRFTGYISDRDKAVLLRGARVLAFPSLHEGFGLPVLEAQAVGVPVVCSNTAALPEAAGDAALLIDPLDTAAISRALLSALTDDVVHARFMQAGFNNVRQFTWERCAQVVLDLLEKSD